MALPFHSSQPSLRDQSFATTKYAFWDTDFFKLVIKKWKTQEKNPGPSHLPA